MRTSRTSKLLALLIVVCSSVVLSAHAASASAFSWIYVRNASNTSAGTLYLTTGLSNTWAVRGGSGTGTSDDCASSAGYLPGGAYSIVASFTNHSGAVVGPAIQLSNQLCHTGRVLRTELFIHSNFPWAGNYKPNGCIKLSSSGSAGAAGGDISRAVFYQRYYGIGTLAVW